MNFFYEIAFLAVFPLEKLIFGQFLKLQKMEFDPKNYSWNWVIWFHEFFGLDFLKFYGLLCQSITFFQILEHLGKLICFSGAYTNCEAFSPDNNLDFEAVDEDVVEASSAIISC